MNYLATFLFCLITFSNSASKHLKYHHNLFDLYSMKVPRKGYDEESNLVLIKLRNFESYESYMKSLLQTGSTKKFVVPSVAVMMTLASTMFLSPVFAVGFFLDQSLQTNTDSSLTAEYRARGFAGSPPGAEVFLTSNADVEFKCTNPKAEGKDQPQTQTRDTTIELKGESDQFNQGSDDGDVSIGPPSTTAEDLCHTSKLSVEVESITYTDIVLHAIPNDSNEPEVTHEFEDVGPINP